VLFVACGPTAAQKMRSRVATIASSKPPATQNYNNIPVHKSVARKNVESIIKAVIVTAVKLLLNARTFFLNATDNRLKICIRPHSR
jgi:hypothetical protein